jgi:hypothetical protein
MLACQILTLQGAVMPIELLPFEIMPFILGTSFLLIWAFIAWVKYRDHLVAHREREAHRHIVAIRKRGRPRAKIDHAAG